jgi:CheY-like chemotaxis protein
MASILIAEDERDIRELINFTLMFAGHTVTTAANGEEAVEKAAEAKPDLIMLDVRMPRMTGYEACRKLKQTDATRDVPVVFLSAKGQDEEVQNGLDVGGVAYILKPFAPDDLTRRVAEILAQAQPAAPAVTPAPAPAEQTPPPADSTPPAISPPQAGQTAPPAENTPDIPAPPEQAPPPPAPSE